MRKVFWENPYQTSLVTKVSSINNNEIVFEDTIAYSFAGGQESDKAFINDMPILSSRMEGNLIYYTLPDHHNLKVGDQVIMKIDWPRRSRLMRLHFTAELILEIVTQQFGFEKIGAHIAESKARIDFKTDTNVSTLFDTILSIYNDIIQRNLPIEKGYLDEANQRRYWKIEGFAQVPCGGTHVNATGEVGFVALKRERLGKSKERIEITLIDNTPLPQA
jgi:Ser-tRNA(Ala) deacylase AlaX